MKKRVATKALLITLILLLSFPAALIQAKGAESEAGKTMLKSAIPIGKLKLPASQFPQHFNGEKKEAAKKSGLKAKSPAQVEKRDGKAGSAKSLNADKTIKPQNHVPPSASANKIVVIVQLQQDPLAVQKAKAAKGEIKSFSVAKSQLEKEQATFSAAVKKLGASPRTRYSEVFNGFSLLIPANQVEKLLTLPGVKAIYPNHRVYAAPLKSITPNMDESAPFIGAGRYWAQGFEGAGVKVGVIDTGVDYRHPSLQGAYQGGYDFVDDDSDPMETPPDPNNPDAATEHGTHVSGTILGRGDPAHPDGPTGWVRGVAPGADLYAYRVLGPGGSGSEEDVISAVEQSVLDGMDVINLSLGSDANDQYAADSIALNNAMLAGVVVVTSNGNSGPDEYTTGSPAAAQMAISVGASTPPLSVPAISASGLQLIYASLMTYSPELGELVGSDLQVAPAGLGTPADFEGKDFQGKVALIQRGSISFKEKSENAKAAGAVAAVVYNNAPGNFGGTLGEPGEYIPTMSISLEEGTALANQYAQAGSLSIRFSIEFQQDLMADFSSRGPALPGLSLKPDITAPGVAIRSSIPSWNGDYAEAYADMQGTSMASPHVAGSAALLLDQHPSLHPFDVKGLLTNHATEIADLSDVRYSVLAQGAGRVNLENTLEAKAIALVEEESDAVRDGVSTAYETGSLSFGRLNAGSVAEKSVTVKNLGDAASTYSLSFQWFGAEGGSLTPSVSAVEVPSGGQSSFTVHLSVPEGTPDGKYEGELRLEGDGERLHLPLLFYVGQVELPNVVSEIAVDPLLFSPNGDSAADTTDVQFKVNSANDYLSLDAFDENGNWVGVIAEEEGGLAPGSYAITGWDGTVSDYEQGFALEDGLYFIVPYWGDATGYYPIEAEASPFVVDRAAPVSQMNDPAITVENGTGTLSGRIVDDLLVGLFGDYSAIGVSALYPANGGMAQADGRIDDRGNFRITVPIHPGENTFEIYVYDAAMNGTMEPAHQVSYTQQEQAGPVALSVYASPDAVNQGDSFDIGVRFSPAEDLYSAQFSLTYDSRLAKGSIDVSPELASYQAEHGDSSLIVHESVYDLPDGMVRSDYVISLAGDFSGFTGSGTLATFHFSGDTPGTYPFSLSNARILNSQGEDLPLGAMNPASVVIRSSGGGGEDQYAITGNIAAEAFGEGVDYSETWYEGSDGTHKVTVEAVDGNGNVAGVGTVAPDGSYRIVAPQGRYTVRVVVPGHFGDAAQVNLTSEQRLNFGPLHAGDVNGDGVIDLADLQQAAKAFGKEKGSGWQNARISAADLNRDGSIDLLDISFIFNRYGERKE